MARLGSSLVMGLASPGSTTTLRETGVVRDYPQGTVLTHVIQLYCRFRIPKRLNPDKEVKHDPSPSVCYPHADVSDRIS